MLCVSFTSFVDKMNYVIAQKHLFSEVIKIIVGITCFFNCEWIGIWSGGEEELLF